MEEKKETLQERDEREWNQNQEDLRRKANPKCHHCYGKGYTGVNVDSHLLQICKCAKKKIDEEIQAEKEQQQKEKEEKEQKERNREVFNK